MLFQRNGFHSSISISISMERRVLVLGLLFFFLLFVISKAEEKHGGNKKWIEDDDFEAPDFSSSSSSSSSGVVQDILMDAISVLTVTSSASPPPLSYSASIIRLIHGAQSYLFPPKLDFRGGARNDADVKDAISKSMETSKVTVEDSAKSAADLAKQTLLNTKEKLKKTLSSSSSSSTEQDL